MKSVTIYKNDLSKPNGRFLIWSPEKSLRHFFFHAFRGVTAPRFYWTMHFLGFVCAGSVRIPQRWAVRS